MIIQSSIRNYEVLFGSIEDAFSALPERSYIVTDTNVGRIYGELLSAKAVLTLPAGESTKSLASYENACRWLLANGCDRKSCIVAFGGGVIGDLAGFIASTFFRGVQLVQIPTSLLAQVDSSVGGKVGINLPEAKNAIGSFYPPHQVRIATEFLNTLPQRETVAGMAEVWKYGAALDASFFDQLESNTSDYAEIVQRCIRLKADVVEADEFETGALRAKLNVGHTVAHALEALGGYRQILHGEAVSVGMVIEAKLGERIGVTQKGTAARLNAALESHGLPVTSKYLSDREGMLCLMKKDKKASEGRYTFSLMEKIGSSRLVEGVREEDVVGALSEG